MVKIIKWGLPLAVIAACVAADRQLVEGQDLSVRRQQLYETNRRIEEAQNHIFRMKRQRSSVIDELAVLDENLARSERQMEDAQFRLRQAEMHLDRIQEEMARTLEGLAEARLASSRRLVNIYKKGNLSYLEMMLYGVDSFSDFVGRLYYMRRMAESDKRILTTIEEASVKLALQRSDQGRRMAEIAAQQQRISFKKLESEVRRKEKEAAKRDFEKRLDTYEKAYDEFLAESKELQTLIQQMAARAAEGHNLGGELGRLMRPVPGPVRSGFGMRFHPILRKQRMHTGVDLAAAQGDPIFAAARGVVIFAGYKRGYGYTVILQHAANYQTLYAHCSALHVSVGQTVEQGYRVASIGATGLATGPHLHFELRHNGQPIDPQIK